MAASVNLDEVVKDYLLYRGLVTTSRQLESELKNDKTKKFRVDKIMECLHSYINTYDLANLRDYWQFLDQRLFSRLEQIHMPSVRKLETSLLKFYIVNAIHNNKPDKVTEFYEKMTHELQIQPEWREWFVLPFIKNPEENRAFMPYFSRQWQDTLFLTLHNFLSVIIRAMVLPPAFEYEEEAKEMQKLRDENARLKKMLADYHEGQVFRESLGDGSEATTPVGFPMGLSTSDLFMDDFSVLTQESPKKTSSMVPRTQQIKSFIKNIGLPSSPILGRRTPPSASAKPTSIPVTSSSNNKSGAVGGAKVIVGGALGSNVTNQKAVSLGKQPIGVSSRSGAQQGAVTTQSTKSSLRREDIYRSKNKTTEATNKIKSKPVLTSGVNEGDDGTGEETSKAESNGISTGNPTPANPPVEIDTTDGTIVSDDPTPFLLLNQEEYGEHHSCITHCRFNHTGQKVATADVDGVVKVWGVVPSPVTEATTMFKSAILSLDWTPTDRLLLGSKSGLVRLYDVKEKKTVKEANMDSAYPRVLSLSCSPHGTSFVCSSAGRSRITTSAANDSSNLKVGRLAIWDLKTMRVERGLPVSPNSIAVNCAIYNHNGQLVISGASDGHIRIYDTRKGECIGSWTAHQGEVYNVMFSSDETSCYSMGIDGKFIEWSIFKTGKMLSMLPIHQGACGPFVYTGHGGYRQVQTPKGKLFAFEQEGRHVLTCAQNGGQIYKLSKEDGVLRSVFLGGHRTPVVALDWSPAPECRMCVTGGMDGKVRLATLLPQ